MSATTKSLSPKVSGQWGAGARVRGLQSLVVTPYCGLIASIFVLAGSRRTWVRNIIEEIHISRTK